MPHTAFTDTQTPHTEDTPQTHREMRTEAYKAVEQSRLHGNTEDGQALREADLQQAEDIAWTLFSDTTAEEESPHETRLLIANVYFEKGLLDDALHFVNNALERQADHQASAAFKVVILAAQEDLKPIVATTPVIDILQETELEKKVNGHRASFSQANLPSTTKPQEEQTVFLPNPNDPAFGVTITAQKPEEAEEEEFDDGIYEEMVSLRTGRPSPAGSETAAFFDTLSSREI